MWSYSEVPSVETNLRMIVSWVQYWYTVKAQLQEMIRSAWNSWYARLVGYNEPVKQVECPISAAVAHLLQAEWNCGEPDEWVSAKGIAWKCKPDPGLYEELF